MLRRAWLGVAGGSVLTVSCAAAPDWFLSPYEDVTASLGVDFSSTPPADPSVDADWSQDRSNGGGAGLLDLDGDGDLDLVLTAPWSKNQILLQGDDGRFAAVVDSGIDDLPMTICVSAADLDQDGLRDLLLCTGNRVALFRNLGDGRFEDVGELMSVPTPGRAEGVAVADVNGDGWVDVFVVAQARHLVDFPDEVRPSDRFFFGRGGSSSKRRPIASARSTIVPAGPTSRAGSMSTTTVTWMPWSSTTRAAMTDGFPADCS